jgi:shikimate kinase
MNPEMSQKLKRYVDIEEEIQRKYNDLKKIREFKDKLELSILQDLKNNNMVNNPIKYNQYKITTGKETVYTNLSYKFIEEQLRLLFVDKEYVNKICNHLKKNRQKKVEPCLKISNWKVVKNPKK